MVNARAAKTGHGNAPGNIQARGALYALDRFNAPRCHERSTLDLSTIDAIVARHMAGHGLQPTGTMILDAVRAERPTPPERAVLWALFEEVRGGELTTLMAFGGITIHELARAMHISGAPHPEAASWMNQWADEPIGDRDPHIRT